VRLLALVVCVSASAGCDWVFRLDHVDPVAGDAAVVQGDWSHVYAGTSATCGIRNDATLWCWGFNGDEKLGNGREDGVFPTPQGPLRGEFQPSATWSTADIGNDHMCAIQLDGTLWCWGDNADGQLGLGSNAESTWPVQVGTATWTAVSAGERTTCAIRADQRAFCWGENSEGELGIGSKTNSAAPTEVLGNHPWKSISVGISHVCGIDSNDLAYCWGTDYSGELGDGGSANGSNNPTPVSGAIKFAQISAGNQLTCGVTMARTAACWGSDTAGTLGTTASDPTVPTSLPGAADWVDVQASDTFVCGVRTSGEMTCWGDPEGTGLTQDTVATPSRVADNTRSIAVGRTHTCKLDNNGVIACAGDGSRGALGPTLSTAVDVPTKLEATFAAIDADNDTTCGRTDNNPSEVYCWGTNHWGEVGDGSALRRIRPSHLTAITENMTLLSVGHQHSCAAGGTNLYCWGADYGGSLGNGTERSNSAVKIAPSSTANVLSLAVGKHACAVREGGGGPNPAFCWGRNNFGQLGTGAAPSNVATTPAQVTVTGFDTIVAGDNHTCAVAGTAVYCWGRNDNSEIGNGTMTDQFTPLNVSMGGTVNINGGLVAGFSRTCANSTTGGKACWGLNNVFGVLLDDGSTATPGGPTAMTMPWKELAIGGYHTCGIDQNNQMWCWGQNEDGQLGDGTRDQHRSPVKINADTNWDGVTAGATHTCARKTDHSVWCWGDNSNGQLGTGTGWTRDFITAPPTP